MHSREMHSTSDTMICDALFVQLAVLVLNQLVQVLHTCSAGTNELCVVEGVKVHSQ